jgi:uncharacterized membrane protein YwzB
MKDIFYSPIVSLILHICMFYFCWTYWSLPTIIFWSLFLVLYTEKRHNWIKFRKQQNKKL